MALAVGASSAKAASPVLEFAVPGNAFPVGFTAPGGEVTAVLADFDTVVHCTGSDGDGAITGPRSTVSDFVFTGCETQGGTEGGEQCKSPGAAEEEIRAEAIEAELVFISQAKRQVGMLLNPSGGNYMDFECGGQAVEASGPFLSPVGPINQVSSSFTASLSRLGATQTPSEYENASGEKRKAIPMGKRGANAPATTGVELSFTINSSVPLEVKAVTAEEIEARQREEEAAATKKRQEQEAAAATAAKKRQEEEAAAAAAVKKRQEEEVKAQRLRRSQLRSKGLVQCREAASKRKRVKCERRVKKKYAQAARKQ